MQIKKYEAVDMQEAIKLIKNDIGPDAVILSTKKVKKGDGVFGLFSRQVVEVVAARDYPDKGQVKENANNPAGDIVSADKGLMEEIQKIRADISVTPSELKGLKAEVGVLKGYLQELLYDGEKEQLNGLTDHLVLFYRRLISEGIDRTISNRLIRILDNKLSDDQKNNIGQINRYSLELLQKQVKITGPVYNPQKGRKIAVFAGPTGVGKTTTIAKIAAKYTLVDKKKVALITFDTFRVGAIEQLKIYAKIIGLPVDVVLSPAELHSVVEKRKDADLILIDTAGRSHRDRVYINEIKELLNYPATLDCHLVLSSTNSNGVLTDIINMFRDLPVNGLLFTKLDEADRFGHIFNTMIKAQIPLSYFTTGQRVPEDIELASPERLCRLILGMDTVNNN